jgi:hypothetical protein
MFLFFVLKRVWEYSPVLWEGLLCVIFFCQKANASDSRHQSGVNHENDMLLFQNSCNQRQQ